MKKYISKATKWLEIFALISVVIFAVGIIFIVVDIPDIGLQIGPTIFGGLMSILFISFFFAEKSRALIIDADKFVFPRGADINGKLSFRKTVIKKNEICSVVSRLHKGDILLTNDCYFHTLELLDGTKVTVTLYAYGKAAEIEILEIIKRSIA